MITKPHLQNAVWGCEKHTEDNQRFACSGWLVYRRYAKESTEGAADMGNNWFGMDCQEELGCDKKRSAS